MKLTWRKFLLEAVAYSAALAIIIAALFVSFARVFVPSLNQHKANFEKIASGLMGAPVTIQEIKVTWSHFEPELNFDHVVVLDPKTKEPKFEIPEITVNMQIWRSILSHTLIFESLKVSGVHMTLHELQSGQVNVQGFGNFSVTDNFTGQSLSPNAILGWVFAQPSLILQDIHMQYFPLKNSEKIITLKKLVLKNSKNKHALIGQAVLNQEVPTKVGIDFQWHGSLTEIAQVKAHLILDLEDVSLPQWFSHHTWHNLEILQGRGNVKLSADWSLNTWQKMHAQFQFSHLAGRSLLTKKNMVIAQMGGDLGWNREGTSEVIAGDNLLIELPHHPWPKNKFKMKFTRDANGEPVLQEIQLGYLDLGDTNDLIQASDLLPAKFSRWLTVFDPEGEVHSVNVAYNGAIMDPTKVTLSGEFARLSFNAWQQFPGVHNFHGILAWDGKQGSLKLDSQQAAVNMNHVFTDPLRFDQLTGQLNWQTDAEGEWTLTAKNLHAMNLDVDVNTEFSLTLPLHDSPKINLTGELAVKNAQNVSHYLPEKIFDPDLVMWLQQAFLGGKLSAGKVVLNGRLSDFPFDHNNGTFMISGLANDVDLNFAPGWPAIHKINGKLTFAGRAMTIELTAGQILDVPLQAVHAEIPYFGDDKPQILTVNGIIKADLSQGLNFIQKSPLQETLGRDFQVMQLQGPMQLKLGLTIPLRKAEDTQVTGDTTVTNANVLFPAWNFALNQVNGEFQFTENSITANKLTGQLFTKPIDLTIKTQQTKNKNSEVIAHAAGQIDLIDIQSWLKLPLDKVMQGKTTFQADVTLPSPTRPSQPTDIVIRSDLQGVAVNLPMNYGKKATDKTDFNVLVQVNEDEPLKAKLMYGKLFSAAVTLQDHNQQMQIASGELRLGSQGVANWQTEPGIIVTGNLDTVSWTTIQPYTENLNTPTKSATNSLLDPNLLRGADLQINKLIFPALQLDKIRVQLTKNPNSITIGLQNALMDGQIIYPIGDGKRAIQANFQRLDVSGQNGSGKSTLNPTTLPPIFFVCNDLRYADANLGRLTINLLPNGSGMNISRLDLDSSAMVLRSTGSWQRSSSNLRGTITSSNVTKLLNSWGFAHASLVGSTGNVNFDLNWQGAPFQPSMNSMAGTLSLKLGKGRIINLSEQTNAEMGFGKMLNVFSLQSIPRRLSLDFSDVFENGYIFDTFNGDFTLREGSAFTRNSRFEGPIAGVGINGRIGIANKDYDLQLDVTPYVTSSLPVVTAIATANPVVGVAAWVVDKMVSGASKINTYRYTITGSWNNPVWAEVKGAQK